MKKLLFLLTIIFLGLHSCKPKKQSSTSIPVTEPVQPIDTVSIIPTLNKDSIISSYIGLRIVQFDSGNYDVNGEYIYSSDLLPSIYESNNDSALWKLEKNRADAIEALLDSKEHGLLPADYHTEKILHYNSNYDNLTYEELADYDLLLSDGVILLSHHLIKGKADPESLSKSWNFDSRDLPISPKDLLLSSLINQELAKNLGQLEPQDIEYKSLKKELVKQQELVIQEELKKVALKSTLRLGDMDSNVIYLRNRLITGNYLSESDTSSSMVYDKKMELAIHLFQHQHGLNSDGIVGPATLKMLNVTAEDKIKMIISNLERKRWIKYPDKKAYIKVNIAAFKMHFMEGGKEQYSSKVMVGQPQTETPTFLDNLELIVFNPTWKLPQSISSTETLNKLQKDSNYLDENQMVLINGKGEIQSHDSIDWSDYSEEYFPFMVRQEPGPNNSLGRVKFLFPNKHAIYLHDTPSKYLFSKEERAFSHGCVRLQNPLDFALLLLTRDDDQWTPEMIDSIIDSAHTVNIRLRTSYPIGLIYQTVGLDQNNEIYYYNDVYGKDEELYQLLSTKERRLLKKEELDNLPNL